MKDVRERGPVFPNIPTGGHPPPHLLLLRLPHAGSEGAASGLLSVCEVLLTWMGSDVMTLVVGMENLETWRGWLAIWKPAKEEWEQEFTRPQTKQNCCLWKSVLIHLQKQQLNLQLKLQARRITTARTMPLLSDQTIKRLSFVTINNLLPWWLFPM